MVHLSQLSVELSQLAVQAGQQEQARVGNAQLTDIRSALENSAQTTSRSNEVQQKALAQWAQELHAQLARANDASIRAIGVVHRDLQALDNQLQQTNSLIRTLVDDRKNVAKNVQLLVVVGGEWDKLKPHQENLLADPISSEQPMRKLLETFSRLDPDAFGTMDTAREYQRISSELTPVARHILDQAAELRFLVQLGQTKAKLERIEQSTDRPFIKSVAVYIALTELAQLAPVTNKITNQVAKETYSELQKKLPDAATQQLVRKFVKCDFQNTLKMLTDNTTSWLFTQLSTLFYSLCIKDWPPSQTIPVVTAYPLPVVPPSFFSKKPKLRFVTEPQIEKAIAVTANQTKQVTDQHLSDFIEQEKVRQTEVIKSINLLIQRWGKLLPANTLPPEVTPTNWKEAQRSVMSCMPRNIDSGSLLYLIKRDWWEIADIHELVNGTAMPFELPTHDTQAKAPEYNAPCNNQSLFFHQDPQNSLEPGWVQPLKKFGGAKHERGNEDAARRAAWYAGQHGYNVTGHGVFFAVSNIYDQIAALQVGPLLVLEGLRHNNHYMPKWERVFYVKDILDCQVSSTTSKVIKNSLLTVEERSETQRYNILMLSTNQEDFSFYFTCDLAAIVDEINHWRAQDWSRYFISP